MATARRWAKVPHLLVIVGEDGLATAAEERHESVGALGGAVLRQPVASVARVLYAHPSRPYATRR